MNYKDYDKKYIGCSDIALLLISGGGENAIVTEALKFGSDGCYYAYIISGNDTVGDHYKLVSEFNSWMKIYDDIELVREFHAEKIKVYRAGEFGCIIQLVNELYSDYTK